MLRACGVCSGEGMLSAVLSDVVRQPAPASLSAFRPVGGRSTAGTGLLGSGRDVGLMPLPRRNPETPVPYQEPQGAGLS